MDFAIFLHFFSRFFAYFQSGTEKSRQYRGIVWGRQSFARTLLTVVYKLRSIRCTRTNNDNTVPTAIMITLPLRIVNSFCRFFAFSPRTSQNMTCVLISGQPSAASSDAETPKTHTYKREFLC